MNEEEKEAIKYLKKHLIPYEDNGKIEFIINDVILQLIDKQQKEIKERLEEIDSLYKMMSIKDDEIEELKECVQKDTLNSLYGTMTKESEDNK